MDSINAARAPAPDNSERAVNRKRSWFAQCCWACSLLAAVIFVGGLIFGRTWLFELTTHFRVQLTCAMVPMALGLWTVRRPIWAGAFGLLTLYAIWSVTEIWIPRTPSAPGSARLRIMSANVLMTNERIDDFLQLVADVQPDILVICEYTPAWEAVRERFESQYPFAETQPRKHGFGIALFSKLPLHDVTSISLLEYFDAPIIQASVEHDGQRLHITAVHAVSPLSRFRFHARNDQLVQLAQSLANHGNPQVVVGDFNATTWSPYLQQFLRSTRLRDSRQGFGLQPSWPQFFWTAMIPIDHAFFSEDIHIHRRWVERDIGSDHFPIVIEISLGP